jgi:hypothetical protein
LQLESSLTLQKAHEEEVASWRNKHAALYKELTQTQQMLTALQSSTSVAAAGAPRAAVDSSPSPEAEPMDQMRQQVIVLATYCADRGFIFIAHFTF